MVSLILALLFSGYYCVNAVSTDNNHRMNYFKSVFSLPNKKLETFKQEWDSKGRYLIVNNFPESKLSEIQQSLHEKGFVSWKTRLAEQGFLLATSDKILLQIGDKPHRVTYSEYSDSRRNGFSNMVFYDHQTRTLYFVFVTDFGG